MAMLATALALTINAATVQNRPLPLDFKSTWAPYRANMPTPQQFLQTDFGKRHSRSDEIVGYFRELDTLSDRITVEEYGRTHEGRPIVYAVVTAPENRAKFAAHWESVKPAYTTSDSPLGSSDLTVIWMGYGIHGNEASGPEAALEFLHLLAASDHREVRDWLQKTVVIVLPDMNPDGRERFVSWVNGNRGYNATTDSQDREHNEPWPGGRTNHYGFDLNRDWFPLTQPESATRHKVYTKWWPHLVFDFHEMGGNSTYFFQPGVPTRSNPNTPTYVKDATRAMAKFHADVLDQAGQRYFMEQSYDDFYVGKGSTYPDVTGSVGILFEQASSRSQMVETPSRLLTYAQTVENQFLTSVSSMRAGLDAAPEIKAHRRTLRDTTKEATRGTEVFSPNGRIENLIQLAELLQAHGVRLHWFKVGEEFRLFIPQGQIQSPLLGSLLGRQKEFEDDQFYDISAWSVDLSMGLDSRPTTAPGSLVDAPQIENRFIGRPNERHIGWVLHRTSVDFFQAVHRLQSEGWQTWFVGQDMGVAKAGDVFVARPENQDTYPINPFLDRIGNLRGIHLTTINGTDNVVSWGGSGLRQLTPATVALVHGSGTSIGTTGQLWHLMDRVWRMPVSLVEPGSVGSADLSRYTVMVVASNLSTTAATSVASWVRDGGTLVVVGQSTGWLGQAEMLSLSSRSFSPDVSALPYGSISAERGRHELPGSIFQVRLDTTHPLTFGLADRLAVMRTSGTFTVPPTDPGTVVGRYDTNEPMLAGYASNEVLANAPDSAAIVAKRFGRGHIVVMHDQPHFRAFFTGPDMLFGNAVFFSEGF